MRKIFTTTFVALLVLAAAVRADAQQAKPAVVISIASYDKLMGGIVETAKLSGLPLPVDKLIEGQILQATGGKGIVGLDKSKPFGAVLLNAAHPDETLVFVPVADLKAMLAALPIPPNQKKEDADGTVHIQGPKPVALKGAGGWVYASWSAEGVKNLPADPDKLLGDLPSRYVVAVRVFFQNISPQDREHALAAISALEMPLAAQALLDTKSLAKMQKLVAQLDELTLGWNVEPATGKLVVEASLTAVPGSELAKKMERLHEGPTNFAGLRSNEAAISLAVSTAGTPTPEELDELKTEHEAALTRGLTQIDDERSLPDTAKPVAKEALSTVLTVWFDTMKTGKRDGGLAVFLGPKPALAVGGYVSDADALVLAAKKLAALAEKDAAMPPIKWDSETHNGRKLSVMTLPVPPLPPAVAFLGGNTIQVVLAAGKEDIWLAAGTTAVDKLEKVIDDSAAPTKGPAVGVTVRAKPIVDKAASVKPDGPAKPLAAQIAAMKEGADQVTLVSAPLPNGVRFRLDLGEGAIKAIAMLAIMGQRPRPLGGPTAIQESRPAAPGVSPFGK